MSECQNVDGEWGEVCPGCGKQLPSLKPISSWKAQRPLMFASGSSAGLGHRGTPRNPEATARALQTRRNR